MTDGGHRSPNGFEKDKPGTAARTEAEADIETLRGRGGIFVEAVTRARMPMVVTDSRIPGNPIVFANDSFVQLSGYAMEEILGQQPHFMSGPDTDPGDADAFRDALERGEEIVVESRQHRRDGSTFCAAVFFSPLLDESGKVIQHFLSYLDITRRVEAEQGIRGQVADLERRAVERTEALRVSEERFRRIVESARDYAIFITDAEDRIVDWLPGAEAVFGWTPQEVVGQPAHIVFTPEDRAEGEPEQELETARREGVAPDVRWHQRKDGRRVFIEGTVTQLRNDDGSPRGYLKIGQDVTGRRRAEEHLRILVSELQHRVRNTMSVVRSIARRTAQNSRSVEEMASHFEGRLDAFARAQAMVTRNPDGGVDLTSLIEDELLAYAAREGEHLVVAGPDISLNPKPAETLSLAIHELTTNAIKYGALSSDRGRLAIRWTISDGRMELRWDESGATAVAPAPDHEGFGLELLQRVVPYELGADTRLDFRPDGLLFTLSMPLEGNVRTT